MPTAWVDQCAMAAKKLIRCHVEGPQAVNPTSQNTASNWNSPNLEDVDISSPCCQFAASLSATCGGISGVLLDWYNIGGATNEAVDVIDTYLLTCPLAPRASCAEVTQNLTQCVSNNMANAAIQAGADPADFPFRTSDVMMDCCILASRRGEYCNAWDALGLGDSNSVFNAVPATLFQDVMGAIDNCPSFEQFQCNNAVQRVRNCMAFGQGIPWYFSQNSAADVPPPTWATTEMPFSGCCSMGPLTTKMCARHNLPQRVMELTSSSVYGAFAPPANTLNFVGEALLGQIENCAQKPNNVTNPAAAACNNVLQGYHEYEGKLIATRCPPSPPGTPYRMCPYLYINNRYYYVVSETMPQGLVTREECDMVPM